MVLIRSDWESIWSPFPVHQRLGEGGFMTNGATCMRICVPKAGEALQWKPWLLAKKRWVDSIHLADNNPIILAVRLIAQIVLWIESFKVIYSITSQCKWCSMEEEDSFTAWNASPIPGGKMKSSDRIKVRGSFSFIITV